MLPVIVIVAIGWIFVVLLMSLTETSFVAGIMTFLFYCVLPLSIIIYLFGTNARRRRRQENNNAPSPTQTPYGPHNDSHNSRDGNDSNNGNG